MDGRVVVLAALLVGAGALEAQELDRRVRELEGRAAFRVALQEGIEVCEDGVIVDERRRWGRWSDGRAGACSRGTAEVVLGVRNGRIETLELEPWEGPGSSPGGTDLGFPGPGEAGAFLTGLALESAGGGAPPASRKAAEHGLMAAVLLRDVEVWPDLLAVARHRDVERDLRRSALFWLSQVAAESVTEGIFEVAADGSEEQDVRDAAVFALSRRPAAESVPALMDLVGTAPHAETRKRALFWLSQIDDPRVIDFFEAILIGG